MQDVIDFNLLKEYDTMLKDVLQVWTKQKAYSLGDKVKYKGHLLECTTAGISGTTTLNFTGLDIGDTITDGTVVWELVEEESGKGIDFYAVGESYEVGDIVIYNGNIYQCITAHTATSTFDATKWTEISASGGVDLPEWQVNTSYTAGKYLVHEGTVYKVDNDFTSGTTFSGTNLTAYIAPIMQGATSSADGKAGMVIKPTTTDVDKFLKGDGTWGNAGGGISIWQSNTAYNVNDVVIDSNLIWQCATAHTSTTTFDESKWVCISGGEISNGLEIVDLWSGTFSFDNSTQGSEPTSSTPTIELSDSIQNYEYLLVGCGLLVNNVVNNQDSIITPTSILSSGGNLRVSIVIADSEVYSAVLAKYDNTHLYMRWKAKTYGDDANIISVQGIRKAKPIVSSGMKYETLWEGEAGSFGANENLSISLSESIIKYKKLGISVVCRHNDTLYRDYYREIDVPSFVNFLTNHENDEEFSITWGLDNAFDYVDFKYSSTLTQLEVNTSSSKVKKIVGISEGVQIPTGVQAARVTLWEGQYNTVNSPLQLSDSIENYDQFELTLSNDGTSERGTFTYNVKDIDYSGYEFRIYNAQDTTYRYSMSVGFVDSTNFRIDNLTVSGWPTAYLLRITGIKYIQPDSYSTEEKLIGTWIDGKPLYRKVFTGTTPSSAGVNTNIFTDSLFTNVDMCYVKDGYIKRDAGSGDIYFYKINESMDSSYGSRIFISGSESSIRGAVGQQLISRPLVVIVEYTKN